MPAFGGKAGIAVRARHVCLWEYSGHKTNAPKVVATSVNPIDAKIISASRRSDPVAITLDPHRGARRGALDQQLCPVEIIPCRTRHT
jgi:hypothetical protein